MVRASHVRRGGLAAEQFLRRRRGIFGIGERRQRLRIERAPVLGGCILRRPQQRGAQQWSGAARRQLRQAAPNGVFIVVVMLAASEMRIGPPPPGRRPTPSWHRTAPPCRVNRGIWPVKRNAASARPGGKGYDITSPLQLFCRAATRRGALPVGIGKARGGSPKRSASPPASLSSRCSVDRVRLDGAVGKDVAKRQSTLGQGPADQQAAVAVERLALRAQKADALAPRLIDDAVEPGTKFGPPAMAS